MNDDPLAALKDIYLPAPPPWWPPATGWWLVAGIFLVIVVLLAFRAYRRWQACAPIRAAKQLMNELFNSDASDIAVAHQCNEILKRLLVVSMKMEHLGRESGEPWLRSLDQIANCEDFSGGPGRALGVSRFAPNQDIDRSGLANCVNALLNQVKPATTQRGRHD